jgi:hypothetical protein
VGRSASAGQLNAVRFQGKRPGNGRSMLRKILWTGLYSGIGAVATLGARRAASSIWRLATGEEPPTKK